MHKLVFGLQPPSRPPSTQLSAVRCATEGVFSLRGALPKTIEFGQPRAVRSGKPQSMKAVKVGNIADCIWGQCCSRNVACT